MAYKIDLSETTRVTHGRLQNGTKLIYIQVHKMGVSGSCCLKSDVPPMSAVLFLYVHIIMIKCGVSNVHGSEYRIFRRNFGVAFDAIIAYQMCFIVHDNI